MLHNVFKYGASRIKVPLHQCQHRWPQSQVKFCGFMEIRGNVKMMLRHDMYTDMVHILIAWYVIPECALLLAHNDIILILWAYIVLTAIQLWCHVHDIGPSMRDIVVLAGTNYVRVPDIRRRIQFILQKMQIYFFGI